MDRRLSVFLVVAFVAILAGVGANFASGWSPPASRPVATSAPSHATPIARLPAVIGAVPTLIPASQSWPTYTNAATGLTVRYPSGWKCVAQPDGSGADFYPPDADPDVPSPVISITFAAGQPYNPVPTPSPYLTQPRPVSVGGVTGRSYQDTGYAVPTQEAYVELPYRGGTLLLGATLGPYLNLEPQLQEMLKTAVLQP